MASDDDLDDAVLAEAMRAGDDDAFAAIYQRYAPRIYDFLARVLGNAAAAEDILQGTFTRAYRHREGLRDPAKVRSWLFTTAHNLAMSHLGSDHPTEPLGEGWDPVDVAGSPEDQVMAREVARLVWDAASSLEPRQYAVIDMSVRQQLTTPEIADILGVDPDHAAVLVNRSKKALGNAVRYLMVARRRDHCVQLAGLVPVDVRSLTPEQRSGVDYHMRHCQNCRDMAQRLTAPAELLAGMAAVPLPAALKQWKGWKLATAVRPNPGPTRPAANSRHRLPGPRIGRIPVLAASGLAALAVVASVAVYSTSNRPRVAGPKPPSAGAQTTGTTVPAAPAFPSAILADHQAPFDQLVNLSGVSCPSVSFCVAVSDSDIFVSSNPTGGDNSWTRTTLPSARLLHDVSCPSVSLCVAVTSQGGNVATTTNPAGGASAWTVTNVDGTNALFDVSCPSVSLCVALDRGNVVTSTNPTGGAGAWTVTNIEGPITPNGLSCPSPTLCVVVDNAENILTSTNPAGGASAWNISPTNGSSQLSRVTCPSVSFCITFGGDGVMTSTNPTGGAAAWKSSAIPGGSPRDLSCPTVSLCVAVDGAGNVLTSTHPSGGVSAWTITSIDAHPDNAPGVDMGFYSALFRVSCPSASLCVTVDQLGNLFTSTKPTGGAAGWNHITFDTVGLNAVSCPTTSLCVAVDNRGKVITTTNPTGNSSEWTVKHVDAGPLNAISCPSTALCVAVGKDTNGAGNVVASSSPTAGASTWTSTTVGNSNHPLTAVSCPSVTLCVAVDDQGSVYASTSPTRGAQEWTVNNVDPGSFQTSNDLPTGLKGLSAVSCPTNTLCVAVDATGNVLTASNPDGGPWTTSNIDGTTGLTGVSCPTASFCVAVDQKGRVFTSGNPTGGAGTWTPSNVNGTSAFRGVSCSASFCAAVDESRSILTSTTPTDASTPWIVSQPDRSLYFVAVSCSSPPLCVAVDNTGHALAFTHNTPPRARSVGRSAAVSQKTLFENDAF